MVEILKHGSHVEVFEFHKGVIKWLIQHKSYTKKESCMT